MTRLKRDRGRPTGDGINDSAVLNWIAEQLARDSAIRPAHAMRSYCKGAGRKPPNEAERVRWHSKWRARGAGLLVAAKERKEDVRETPRFAPSAVHMALIAQQLSDQSQSMCNLSIQETVARLAVYRGVGGSLSGTYPIPLTIMDAIHKQLKESSPSMSTLTKVATLNDILAKAGVFDTFRMVSKFRSEATLSTQMVEAMKIASSGLR